jgi:cold shock CspA family protein
MRTTSHVAHALAEPVRRIAQPLTVPPGIDYHRLSADEHNFIFDELIVPTYLSNITPQEAPVVQVGGCFRFPTRSGAVPLDGVVMTGTGAGCLRRAPGRALVAADWARADAGCTPQLSCKSWGLTVPSGVVKWFDPGRGLGVIAQDSGGPDAVAHRAAVHGDAECMLVAGNRVLFDVTLDAAGVRADNIRQTAGPGRPSVEGPGGEMAARP